MHNKLFLFGLIISLFMFESCSSEQYEYAITYKVYYTQDYVQTYFDTCIGNANEGYLIGSDKGSNYIIKYAGGRTVLIDSSAPIEIISNTKKPLDKNKRYTSVNDLGFNVNEEGNLVYTNEHKFPYTKLRLVTIEFEGEKHEYVYASRHHEYEGGIALSHWEGCKYCKECNNSEQLINETNIEEYD